MGGNTEVGTKPARAGDSRPSSHLAVLREPGCLLEAWPVSAPSVAFPRSPQPTCPSPATASVGRPDERAGSAEDGRKGRWGDRC